MFSLTNNPVYCGLLKILLRQEAGNLTTKSSLLFLFIISLITNIKTVIFINFYRNSPK